MATQYHTIASGESLWGISRLYNTTVDELVRLNGFASANVMIHPGQVIIVKQGSTTPTPDPTTPNSSLNKVVQWFYDNQSRLRYSQPRRLEDGYADCSSAIFRALIFAGFLPAGTFWGNTASLFNLEGTLFTPIQRNEARLGDVFVTGYKPIGSHAGMFVNNNEVIHMINEEHHIKQTPVDGWVGAGNMYCYRIVGGSTITDPTPTPDPTPIPDPDPTENENTINSYTEYGTFTTNRSVAIRNQPKESSSAEATLYSGESVTYDSVYVTNKFIYISYVSYVSYSGVRRYLAIRTHINGQRGPVWGTIV